MRGLARRRTQLLHPIAAVERTSLAWERTGIGLAGLGALLVKLPDVGPLLRGGGLLLIAGALVVVVAVTPWRYRTADRDARAGAPAARGALLLALSAGVCLVGLLVLADLFLP